MPNLNDADSERRFLEACPSFRRPLEEFRRDWGECERPSFYLVLDALGRHLAGRLDHGDYVEVDNTLKVVEEMFEGGDESVLHATTLGLLSELQSETKKRGLDPAIYVAFFGPKTREWWNDLRKNWEGQHDW